MKIKTNCSLDAGVGASSAWYLTKAFHQLGHELVTGYEADLVINIDGMKPVDQLSGIPYFFWDTDSFLHVTNPGIYDQIFIGGCPEDLVKYPEGTVFLPHAFDPEIHKPYDEEKEFDIVMIGKKSHQYHKRNDLVGSIINRGYTVLHMETEPGEDYARAMSKGKLIFNHTLGERNIPMRFFEGMAIGCLLENYTNNLDKFAVPHEHYIPYVGERGLMMQIEYYLSHPEERGRIIQQARKHVLDNHTYIHRAKTILSYL